MSEKKYLVPEGMLSAATQGATAYTGVVCYPATIQAAVEAALRWLAENPIVPSRQWSDAAIDETTEGYDPCSVDVMKWCTEWQRRMFLAPEPEIPEAVKDVMAWFTVYLGSNPEFENIQRNVLLAYSRGRESK